MKVDRKRYYLKYSILFICFAGLIAYFYYSQGKSMAHYTTDGFRQHFRALVYISNYFKEILNNIFVNKTFVIPQWDFAIGEGSDLLEALHYYSLGDPIDLLGIFVPTNRMYLFYDFSIFFRMYVSGIGLSELCFYTIKKETGVGIMCGALLYAFSSYALCVSGTHIYFLNACMYLPLVLLGVEHVFKSNKSVLLAISVTLSAISNVYFFYMIVIATVIYVTVRIIFIDLTIKEKLNKLFFIFIYSLIGVLIGAFVFLPMFRILIGNSRITEGTESNIFYSVSYYLNDLKSIVYSNGYFGGYSLLGLFSIVLVFTSKGNKTLRMLFIICTVFVCFPFFGKMFNGFSYTNERWLFIYDLLMCYMIAYSFEDIVDTLKNKKILMTSITIIYTGMCIYINRVDWKIYALFMMLGLISILIIYIIRNVNYRRIICFGICLFSILFSVYFRYSNSYWGFARNGSPIEQASNVASGEFNALDSIDDNTFYRYSGDSLTTNASIHGDVSTTGYYWSIANNNVIEFRKNVGLSDSSNHHYDSYNDSYILNTLASVKYYIKKDGNIVPYDYEPLGNQNGYNLYKTKSSLPLVYAYDSYINEEEWNKLDLIPKQEVLTNSVVLKEETDFVQKNNNQFISEEVEYIVNSSDGVEINDGSINVIRSDGTISLGCNNKNPGEYYLVVNDIESSISSEIEISINSVTKLLRYIDKTNPSYSWCDSFAINLGYFDTFNEEILIKFPDAGTFNYGEIKIVCLPLENVKNNLMKLDCTNYEYIKIETNKVSTKINLDNNKIVCFPIPYSNGWKAYVDGQEAKTITANIQYIGIPIIEGQHEIELKYSTPLLKEGSILSLIGLVLLSALTIYKSNKKHKC